VLVSCICSWLSCTKHNFIAAPEMRDFVPWIADNRVGLDGQKVKQSWQTRIQIITNCIYIYIALDYHSWCPEACPSSNVAPQILTLQFRKPLCITIIWVKTKKRNESRSLWPDASSSDHGFLLLPNNSSNVLFKQYRHSNHLNT
jgi:hypothetical protein